MTQSPFSKKLLFAASSLAIGSTAFAAGFEKNTLWSGKYVGIAGAAASSVKGSESLMFNPAGLASGENIDVSVNLSPTWTQIKAPIVVDSTQLSSKTSLRLPFGVTGKYALTPDLGLGLGFFASGGSGADYGEVDFSANTALTSVASKLKPNYKSEVTLLEGALGVGYKVAPGFNVGASYRLTFVSANFTLPSLKQSGTDYFLSELALKDLKKTNFAGFRIGAQWQPEGQSFGLGLSVRTPVKFTAKGTSALRVASTNAALTTALDGTGGDASVTSTFPLQVALSGHYKVTQDFTTYLEYVFTNYATDKSLKFSGTASLPALLGGTSVMPVTVDQQWKNMHNVRLGFAYNLAQDTALRLGYVFTSAVVPAAYARPTFSAPGAGHTFTVGAGHNLTSQLSLDAAFGLDINKGTVSGQPAAGNVRNGNYTATAYALHVGSTYVF